MSKSIVIEREDREAIAGPGDRSATSRGSTADSNVLWKPNWQNCYPSTVIDEPRRATPGWCGTVTYLNASCRPAWAR